ncbi:MAG TPA: DUF222 domain-containing protein, partial [Streptosporangiaceae bacterium]|nr:DUF222 domain-containing protein [Streptosporangiaceae bacterium]
MTDSGAPHVPADGWEPDPGSGLPVAAPDGDGLRWSFELDLVSALEALGRPLRDWEGVDQEADLAAEAASLGFTDTPPGPSGLSDGPPGPSDGPPGPSDGPPEPPGGWAEPDAAADLRGADLRRAGLPGADLPAADLPGAGARASSRAGMAGRGRGRDLGGAVAEVLPAGPGLAAWLAGQDPGTATGGDLAAMAGAFRRLASWAQARELDLIARLTAACAEADPNAGLAPGGRPAFVTGDAAAQVALELIMSRVGAEAWAGLAVTLRWRLPATAAALAEGRIDTYRAKIIAEAVLPLSDTAATAVEDRVLPRAGDLTYAQLHAAVRRAVIAADPEGAEHRRQAAERRAKVGLYPGQDHTASLGGYGLPAPEATAGYARICAMAAALQAAGAGGGIDFLRAQVFLGILLGTLPPIPPPPGAPPDTDPPPAGHDDGWAPGPPGEPPHDPGGPSCDVGDPPHDASQPPRDPSEAPHGDSQAPWDDASPQHHACDPPHDASPDAAGPAARPAAAADPWPEVPPLSDADLPDDDGYRGTGPPPGSAEWYPVRGDPLDDHHADPGIQWPWPPIPPHVPAPPAARPAAPGAGPPGTSESSQRPGRPPPADLLDLALPWAAFTGTTDTPATLGRIGPITAPEARRLAGLALRDPAAQWRIILTDPVGHAIAVTRVPRARTASGIHDPPAATRATVAAGGTGAGPAVGAAAVTGIIGRVTIVIPAGALDTAPAASPGLPEGIYTRLLTAARRARDHAHEQADADRDAPGGCAHTTASPAYQPPPRIREHVTARDRTCRHPGCGQPAWHADLDHTTPHDQGGHTCPCNLGA